jgi:hypothetical protein
MPPKPKVTRHHVKRAVDHAMLLCRNFEDTVECRLAWDEVEDLSRALARTQKVIPKNEEVCADDPLACREYEI